MQVGGDRTAAEVAAVSEVVATTPAEAANPGSGIGIGLADAIGLIRSELQRAADAGGDAKLAFKPTAVEVELEVAFNEMRGVAGGFQLRVLSFGAKGERSAGHTQRLKVTFEPIDRSTGTTPEIADIGPR